MRFKLVKVLAAVCPRLYPLIKNGDLSCYGCDIAFEAFAILSGRLFSRCFGFPSLAERQIDHMYPILLVDRKCDRPPFALTKICRMGTVDKGLVLNHG